MTVKCFKSHLFFIKHISLL